ncbi:MAG: DUF692 domain-containing protein [Pseudomonadota bacterium]
MAAVNSCLPLRAGIGLRAAHYQTMLETLPDIAWLEIYGENYFGAGGQPQAVLRQLRAHYPLSIHCVGLSLGSAQGLDRAHLAKLKTLVERFAPAQVSDHLSWGAVDGRHFNELLPLPYNEESLALVCRNVAISQDYLGRRILLENIARYLSYSDPYSTIPESVFLAEVARRTGCGILLDLNNLYVTSRNLAAEADPLSYLNDLEASSIGEIHLAGFEEEASCLIDTHSRPVSPAVWALYAQSIALFGPVPTLIEWDKDIPALSVLLNEARRADQILLAAAQAAPG